MILFMPLETNEHTIPHLKPITSGLEHSSSMRMAVLLSRTLMSSIVPFYGKYHYGHFMENLSQNFRGYIFSLIWHFPVPLALWDIENLLKTQKRPIKVIKAISKAIWPKYEKLIIFSWFWHLLVSSNWWFQYFVITRSKRPKRPLW